MYDLTCNHVYLMNRLAVAAPNNDVLLSAALAIVATVQQIRMI